MTNPVKVQFWGTRGGLAKPGPKTVRYGGNTSCVQVTSPGGSLLVIDCGTGAHDLGRELLAKAKGPLRGSILISHTHWDHIQGFPFFAPLFVPGGQWDIYGPSGLGSTLRDTLAGQMESTYFPIALDDMGAEIRFHNLVEGAFDIDDIHITTHYLNHPALTLSYRLEMGDTCVVYACDHEPYARPQPAEGIHPGDRRHSEFLAGADLVIHDAQFTEQEYPNRRGWGHSPVDYVCEMGELAGVKQIALTHHDPGRDDDGLDQFIAGMRQRLAERGSSLQVFAPADGQIVEVAASGSATSRAPVEVRSATQAIAPALLDATVIICVSDPKVRLILQEALAAEKIQAPLLADEATVLPRAKSSLPAFIILEHQAGGMDGLSLCAQLRSSGPPHLQTVRIVVVSESESQAKGAAAGVTEWLVKPFSPQYARTQIQKGLLLSAARWARAALPADEEQRLGVLHDLSLLDSPREERFDRITRLAANLGEVPIALVSLLDRSRQWFKSCFGMELTESGRDYSFCSHVVYNRQPVIVNDTLLDDRFADNPLVVGKPRIRFYAGFPIFHQSGVCLGTLCMIDVRPRQFSSDIIKGFEDLASLVQRELSQAAK